MKQLTDLELIERFKADKDNRYFGELFSRYKDKVYGKCLTMVKRKQTAEDLTQDILIKTMEKIGSFKGNASFSTWLYSITYNQCIEFLRQTRRLQFDDWADSLDFPEEIEENEIEEILDLKSSRLTLLLEILTPQDKALILLKYQEGFDLKKIMHILSLDGESATKMRLNRAKKRLVAVYKQFYDSVED